MKIGINLLNLQPGKIGGMEVYFLNLFNELLKIDQINEYYLITSPQNDTSIHYTPTNCKKILYHALSAHNKKWNFIHTIFKKRINPDNHLVKLIEEYKFDIWFCPFLSLYPHPLQIPSIVTIPDLQHEYYPKFFSLAELAARKSYIGPSIKKATRIITISEFSKKSFIEKFYVNPEKIAVIYLAASDLFLESFPKKTDVKTKYHLPANYFFYPANAWPHKNHQILIIAFNLYRKIFDNSAHLVLTGSGLKNNRSIIDLISLLRLNDAIHILDYVQREDMPELYKCSKALVFPSLFEGFGIPLLEAMATRCPIIASNSTSIPEVVGDAAYLFDPKNPQSICDAMHRIVDNDVLRETLIKKGKDRVTQYSYEKVARMHLDLFNSLYSEA